MDGSSSNPEDPVTYRSYLLRVWQEGKAGDSWRASLQSAATGERQGFASLDDLFGYIRSQIEAASDLYQDVGEIVAPERR